MTLHCITIDSPSKRVAMHTRRRSVSWKPAHAEFAGEIPLILKVNDHDMLHGDDKDPDQADHGQRGGCVDGSARRPLVLPFIPAAPMLKRCTGRSGAIGEEAKRHGIDRGDLELSARRGVEQGGRNGHRRVRLRGAHRGPTRGEHRQGQNPQHAHLEQEAAKKIYEAEKVPIGTIAERINHVVKCTFDGRRIVIFSGGAA